MTDSFERESDINLLGSVSQLVMKSMQKSEQSFMLRKNQSVIVSSKADDLDLSNLLDDVELTDSALISDFAL